MRADRHPVRQAPAGRAANLDPIRRCVASTGLISEFMRVLAIIFVTFVSTPTIVLPQSSQCLPADDGGVVLLQFAKHLITSTDSLSRMLSRELGLADVSVSQLAQVTSGEECARAAAAVDRLASTPNSGRRVYLVTAGSRRFLVKDPRATAGEWSVSWLFDRDWKFIRALLGG